MVEFGLQIEPQFGFDYDQIRDLAHLCEDVGFSSIWCSDHLFLDGRSQERDCWEAWTTLTALAVETTTLRIGPLVSCVSYRHPSILAKIAACVDVMSGGRLEMGIGAGWKQIEYEAYGIPFPSAKERVDRLEDSLNIITKMWTEPEASFQGKYYEIDGAFCSPKPAQAPHPPVWIGGDGPRVLGLAARFADGINIGSHPSVERYADLMAVLEAACERQGRDFRSIKKSHFLEVATAADRSGLDALLRGMAREAGSGVDEFRAGYGGHIGTPRRGGRLLPGVRGAWGRAVHPGIPLRTRGRLYQADGRASAAKATGKLNTERAPDGKIEAHAGTLAVRGPQSEPYYDDQ